MTPIVVARLIFCEGTSWLPFASSTIPYGVLLRRYAGVHVFAVTDGGVSAGGDRGAGAGEFGGH